jgi:hypothetical protein
VDNRRGESWPRLAGYPASELVEELDQLPAARHRFQPQGDEHRSTTPANHRHRIHQPGRQLLSLNPQNTGATDRWPTGPLDSIGDRLPQAKQAPRSSPCNLGDWFSGAPGPGRSRR